MSGTRPCPHCGTPNPEAARFCAQCGATLTPVAAAPAPAPAPAGPAPAGPAAGPSLTEARPASFGMKTVVGVANVAPVAAAPAQAPPVSAAPIVAPPAEAAPAAATSPMAAPIRGAKTMIGGTFPLDLPQPQIQMMNASTPAASHAPPPVQLDQPPAVVVPPAPATPSKGLGVGTMIGMPAANLLPPQLRDALASPQANAPPKGAASLPAQNKTMLGVAMPGIAPVSAGAPPPHLGGNDGKTMMGVAMPGIAPLAASAPEPTASRAPSSQRKIPIPAIVPAPAPLVHDSLPPPAPPRVDRRGVPLAAVAGGALFLVLAVGGLVAVFWKGGPALLVQPRLSAAGKEQLHLVCESCADGTTASLGSAKTTFTAHEADLDLTTPLKLGDNPIQIDLDRPGVGRDETVKAVVPVAYRVRADLGKIGSDAPAITVQVEAVPGTEVKVDGTKVDLDAQGHGSHDVSLANDTTGPSDEGKVVERTIPYEVVRHDKAAKGATTEKGAVAARVGVIPLRVDAPTSQAVTESAHVWVSGRTSKGGIATVNGQTASASANGSFAVQIDLPPGETTIDVRASASQVASRVVHFKVTRVDRLEAEAKSREASSPLTYDAFADATANAGKAVAVEGAVLEARGQNHQTVIVLDDKRGCAKSPCVVRLVHGEDDTLRTGEIVRAYGRVTRGVTASDGKTVPEVEADLLLRGKAPK